MTTEQPPLMMSPQVALADALWYARNPPTDQTGHDELLRAAYTLAKILQSAAALRASSIGADDYLSQFDGGDNDSVSFYRGVNFVLDKVQKTLGAWE